MKNSTTTISKGRTCIMAALVTFTLAGAAQAMSSPSDAWITTKVKLSLAASEGLGAAEVNVDTIGRQVTLHGIVNSAGEKQAAETAAKDVQGVKSVRNLLQVVSAKREDKVEAKDADIEKQISTALDKEPSLKDSSISVQSVNKGVVILKGTADNMSDQLTAVRIARRVPGTRQVATEIQTTRQDEVGDSQMWKGASNTAGKAAESVGDAAGGVASASKDLYITSIVKTKLLADSNTPAMDINVDTEDGVVTLFGMVPTAESKAAAEARARETSGVAKVKNELQIVASAKQESVKADDAEVEANVKKELAEAGLGEVNVDVKDCVARLTGTVPSGIERVEALQVARATSGVCAVKDDLTVK